MIIVSTVTSISVDIDFENSIPAPPIRSNNKASVRKTPIFDPFANLDIIKRAEEEQIRYPSKAEPFSALINNLDTESLSQTNKSSPALNTIQSTQSASNTSGDMHAMPNPANSATEENLRAYLKWLQSVYLSNLNTQALRSAPTKIPVIQSRQFVFQVQQADSQLATNNNSVNQIQDFQRFAKPVISPGMYLPVNQTNQILKHFDNISEFSTNSSLMKSRTTNADTRKNSGFRYGSGFTFHF